MIWLEDNPLDSLDPLLGKASPTGRVFFDPDGELLVGGLVAINFILPYIGNFIIPIDFNIFFFQGGGPGPPTRLDEPLVSSKHGKSPNGQARVRLRHRS